VKTSALTLECPVCHSRDVFYTCTPDCCFNHVCNDCRTTFEPMTARLHETLRAVEPPDPLPDASDPTVGCVNCGSTAVYVLADGRLVCAKCCMLLRLEITEVSPG
jgi:hypothetical protein